MIKPSTVIVMEEDKVTVTVTNRSGIKKVTNTNVENIQQIFMREQAMETPLLPSQWGVVKYYRKNNYEGYVLTTPPTERNVTFTVNRAGVPGQLTVPVPPLVWIFELMDEEDGGKKLMHTMMYVLKHELLSLKDKVWHAPFPNIGVSHGICWGHGNLPVILSSKSIQNIPARFFQQPFNFDLSINRVRSFEHRDHNGRIETTDNAVHYMMKIARQLEEKKAAGEPFDFPFEDLKPVGTFDVEQVIRNTMPGIFH